MSKLRNFIEKLIGESAIHTDKYYDSFCTQFSYRAPVACINNLPILAGVLHLLNFSTAHFQYIKTKFNPKDGLISHRIAALSIRLCI